MKMIELINDLCLDIKTSGLILDNEVFMRYDLYENEDKVYTVDISETFDDNSEVSDIINRNIKYLENKIELYIITRIVLKRLPFGPSELMLEDVYKELDKFKSPAKISLADYFMTNSLLNLIIR